MIKYYTVGGAVRDELLGIKSKDIDFAVEAESYDAMKEDILARGYTIFQERPEFFAIRARHPEYGGVDFTLCRKEGFYSDSRHPDDVQVGTILDDLARRDFTVNAIAKGEDGILIDPYHGTEDLALKVLVCVGNTYDRLSEDPLRILRAVRFHLVRGFEFDEELEISLGNYSLLEKLRTISLERIYEELVKCYQHDTYGTMWFLREHAYLESIIFDEMGMALMPRIP